MSLQGALYEYWTAQSGITDLTGTRIYRLIAPTSATKPYVVYQIISEAREPHMTAAGGLVASRVQVVCCDDTAEDAETVAEAIRAEMDGYKDTTMGSGDNATTIRRILLDGAGESMEPPSVGSEVPIYTKRQDYVVWHQESVPTF